MACDKKACPYAEGCGQAESGQNKGSADGHIVRLTCGLAALCVILAAVCIVLVAQIV